MSVWSHRTCEYMYNLLLRVCLMHLLPDHCCFLSKFNITNMKTYSSTMRISDIHIYQNIVTFTQVIFWVLYTKLVKWELFKRLHEEFLIFNHLF